MFRYMLICFVLFSLVGCGYGAEFDKLTGHSAPASTQPPAPAPAPKLDCDLIFP